MKKRILSLVTALALSLTVVPVSVLAAEEQGETVSIATAVDATALPSNDELFLGYIQQRMYSNPQLTPFSNYGESTGVLNDKELAVYRELKGKIKDVAAQGGSTEFALTTNLGISWTTTSSGDALKTEAEQHFNTTIDMGKIVDCLLVDCPYELYWFDKTEGYSTSYAISKAGNTATISDVNVAFMVATSYQSGNTTTVKSDVSTVSTAITNAKEIVAQYAAKTDYQKLKAYKDEICDLVSYNYDATDEGTPYGDPWQIIYVFDEDPDTKVVCEGYAKAFQYLCDLSDFTGNTTCYTVTGTMDGGTGAGPHMWNIVRMEGQSIENKPAELQSYLVDITNCDEGSVGYPDKLFLKGYTSGDPTNGYTFSFDSSSITYTYDKNTTELYSEEILSLTNLSYTPAVTAVTVSGTYTYNGLSQTPTVTVETDGEVLTSDAYDLSYQQNGFSVTELINAGTYTVVATGKGAYAGVAEATFTILPADYTYTKPTVETNVTVHQAYPAGGAETATGVSNETVDGTLAWYLDDQYKQPANGAFGAAGSTTLYWQFTPAADETNYVTTAKMGSVTFTVSDLPAQNVSFTDNDAADGAVDKIYGDASFAYAATSDQNGAITYESSATDVATVNSATGEVTIHGVGEAIITATAAATDTHGTGSASYTLTVSPKGLTMTATAADKVYDGTSNVTVTAGALTGIVNSDTVSVAETSVTGTLDDPYVGTDKAITLDSGFTLTGEDAGKYTLTQPTVTGTVTAAADPAVIIGTATVKKDGNTVDLSKNVSGAKGTVTYKVTDGAGTVDQASGVYTSPADSGSATVTVTIADTDLGSDSTPEYTGKTATITVTITDKDTDTDSMTVTIAGWTYGETANAPVISGVSGGTATYSYSGTGDTSYASSSDAPTDAGTYRVDATYETNDTIYTASANFTIAKAESTLTAPTPVSNLTYTGSAQNLINAGSATGGEMQYSLTGGNDYVAAIPAGVDAGTYTVWYKVIGDANHTDIAPASVTVAIAKAKPSCTAPTAEGATFGETLNDVTLSGGTGDGTWAWKDSSVSVGNVGTNSFVAVFTPTDAQNYNTVEVNVTVTVQKADYAGETAVPATAVYNNTAQQTINLSQYLPAGCGTYTLTAVEGTDADNILAEVGQTGSSVTFKLTEGLTIDKAGKTATITATFVTENYNDIVLTVTVTLVEKEIYTVTFHANGGSGTMAAQTVEQGQSFTFPANGFTAPSGYRFKCWAYNSVAGNQYSVGATLTISANADIYAVWEIIPTTTPGNDNTYEPPYTPPASSNTEKNPDGSTTTTTTKPDGTVTETTKNPDGSKEVVETKKDGTVTTTTTDKTGNVTETVKNPDGSAVTTVENKDGSSSTTTVSENGKVESTVTLPKSVITDAAANYETVTLPMPAVSATTTRDEAPTVTVKLPAGTSAVVEIPVERVSTGTVAVLVKADGTEEIIKTSITTENGVTVSLSAGATVKIVDNTKYFSDVSVSYWGSDAIDFVTSRELFNGTSNDTFSPEATMNRAMIVTVLARLEDVDTSTGANWYDAGRQWAMETGISDGSDMDGSLTREQLAVMLYRYAGSPAVSGSFASYQDGAAVSAWANDAMLWAMEAGIITGISSDTIAPQNNAFRVQVATMLMRFIAMQ